MEALKKNHIRGMTFLIIALALCYSLSYADEQRYQIEDIIDNHGAVMLVIDPETGRILDSNASAETFYGYSKTELTKMNISQINIFSEKKIKEEMSLAAKEKRNYFLFKHKLKDGTLRDVEVYSSPSKDIYGKDILFSIIHDVTPRMEAERENTKGRVLIVSLLSLVIIGMSITVYYMNFAKNRELRLKKRFQSLFENMGEGFALHRIVCDAQGVPVDYIFLDINQAFENITKLKAEDVIGKNVKTVFPNTEAYWIEKYGEVAVTGENIVFTSYSQELDKYFNVNVYSPNSMEFATIFTDITDQVITTEKIELERKFLKTILHSLGDGVISIDGNGNIDLMNAVAENLTGWNIEEAKGMKFEEVFEIVNEFTRQKCESPVKQVFELGEIVELENHTILIKKNGHEIPIEDSAAPIKGEGGDVIGVVLVFRDYTEKKEKQDKIIYLSYHDQLTGLYNRRFFEEELLRLDTERNLPFTIAMVDVNGLKLTNDAFGHLAGDRLLVRVSKILKNHCRTDDIIARIGGDEFVILLPQTSYEEAEKVVNRIYKSVENCYLDQIVISVSIGWDTKESVEQTIRDTFIKAEEHMYRKKLTESQSMRNETIKAILKTVNEKSEREKIHAEKVSEISKKIGKMLNLPQDVINEIGIAGLMHDIGKIGIDDAVLNKKGALTEEEYIEIKRHPEGSYHILKAVDAYTKLADYVLSHHERWDGKGYPRGISGDDIPLVSRIIAVADAFEAMTSSRPYRETLSESEALLEINKNAGTQFDPEIAHRFVQRYDEFIE